MCVMLILYTAQTHILHRTAKLHIYQLTKCSVYIYTAQKDPHVGDVRFHQEFGKRLGNGNINLQRCKQFPPLPPRTMGCPNQHTTSPHGNEARLSNYCHNLSWPFSEYLGPFFRSYVLLRPSITLFLHTISPVACGTMVVNRWRVYGVYYTILPSPRAYICAQHHSVYSIRRRRRKGVRITPKGNVEGFPTLYYIPLRVRYSYTRAKPSGKRNELVFSAVSLLHDTLCTRIHILYTHIYTRITLEHLRSYKNAYLISFLRKILYFFLFPVFFIILCICVCAVHTYNKCV